MTRDPPHQHHPMLAERRHQPVAFAHGETDPSLRRFLPSDRRPGTHPALPLQLDRLLVIRAHQHHRSVHVADLLRLEGRHQGQVDVPLGVEYLEPLCHRFVQWIPWHAVSPLLRDLRRRGRHQLPVAQPSCTAITMNSCPIPAISNRHQSAPSPHSLIPSHAPATTSWGPQPRATTMREAREPDGRGAPAVGAIQKRGGSS